MRRFMTFLEKLQNLPERKKKIILWISIVIVALFLFAWYFQSAQKVLQASRSNRVFEEELKIPGLQEKMGEMLEKVEPGRKEFEGVKDTFKGLIKEAEEESTKLQVPNNK